MSTRHLWPVLASILAWWGPMALAMRGRYPNWIWLTAYLWTVPLCEWAWRRFDMEESR